MRNLIVCCDGTWNSLNNKDDGVLASTNVFKFFNAIDTTSVDTEQLSRYQAGVGTGGIVDKILGGGLGVGLGRNIRDCYQWLCLKYQPGDNICLFGFSRGAFTARSLGGMISKYGIANLTNASDWDSVVKKIYDIGYRKNQSLDNIPFYKNSNSIHFIGVWDTVGALGIPDDKSILNLFDNSLNYRFHNTKLSNKVSFARHALATDEQRGSFSPTLWDIKQNSERVKQVWFPGVHADIGGGYKESGLSDCTLQWMIKESKQCGMIFKNTVEKQISPNALDKKHDSHTGLMKALITMPRHIPPLEDYAFYDSSVKLRRKNSPIEQPVYLPCIVLTPNTPVFKDIYSKQPWNWTGIYLVKDKTYQLSASGQWLNSNITCDPNGNNNSNFNISKLAQLTGSALGVIEKLFKSIGMSKNSDFIGTKRIEKYNWFSLIGAIANQGNPNNDGTPKKPEYFLIGNGCQYTPSKSGYLYCFANDAWGFYGNNRGFVTLKLVEQVSKKMNRNTLKKNDRSV